ncbi:MAG: NAD(P)-dependent oxidoreductase [Sphingomonas bacterium]|uniref:NAD(P)-dependent oxidoreductase n=1 Tax=Sphingomonas bacterium TaxID=1895847 RepID=UPI0026255F44|nr:NAD(P)-dependent oxidoreductase [Sphingomonas bacterium]MDB5704160.1 NAD(P)-dependent oxidoreductase [Sphingomonas bacterium]
MDAAFAFIGFGEAGTAFAGGAPARGYDRKTDQPDLRAAKLDDFAKAGVTACADPAEAIAHAPATLSLVTADQALAAARSGAHAMEAGAFWFDMNSVAPDTKRAAARLIEAAGGRYVDVAVMAPVHPARRAVPLLLSGPHAGIGATVLAELGFTNVTVLEGPVGAASSIKMIRSVMVKGLEALTAECFLAAEKAGVADEVVASLNASWPGIDWADKTDYNLDRMMVHGLRRAAEMEEVVKTLNALGTGSAMTRGTVERQRAIGLLGLTPPDGLKAKFAALFRSMIPDQADAA